jgi:hypothetical protein
MRFSNSTSIALVLGFLLSLNNNTNADVPVDEASTQYSLNWYPQATYNEFLDHDDTWDEWRRCGSGAYIAQDDHQQWYCDAGTNDFETEFNSNDPTNIEPGNDCQTVSPWAAQTGGNTLHFELVNGQGEFKNFNGQRFTGVIKLFEHTYCTGTGVEFYTQPGSDTNGTPLDENGHTPEDNGFGDTKNFNSFYVYAKPNEDDGAMIPMIENTIGFKFMPFPDHDMFPEDQTTCVPDNNGNGFVGDDEAGSKFLYVPFTNSADWPGLDCVSSFDRPSCFELDNELAYGMFQAVGNGDSYAQVDFAGCSTVTDSKDYSNVYNPNGYCYGSTLPNLNAFPVGSFYHNVYTIQGGGYCEDSQQTNPFGDTMNFCYDDTYDNYCMTVKFYDCFSRSCKDDQSAVPDDTENGPYFYVTTSVKDFCPGGNQQNGRMDNLDTMMYVDDTNSEIGSAADYLGWPARATGYTAILELCQ